MDQDRLKRYIRGEATPEEKEQTVVWAKADVRHMKELLALRKLYDVTIWQKNEALAGRKKKRTRATVYAISIAAAVFLLLIISNYYMFRMSQKTPEVIMQTIRVPAGQRAELVLTDGTSVWLNAGSTFTFPNYFDADKRVVTLDGEGYFNVRTTNAQKPFIVKTSSHAIEARGTAFNVLAYQKSLLFEVSLIQGKVEVSAENTQIELQPGERVFLADGRMVKEEIRNYDYLLWKDGIICFDDEPVNEMIRKLELYFDTQIIVKNVSFTKKKYTGKFRTKDGIEHILKVFQLKDNFLYERDDENNQFIIK